MADGGSYRNLDTFSDIQKTMEDASDTLNRKSAESARFCRETKHNINRLPDSEKAAICNTADMIMDAAAELRKSVESVEKQASGLKMLTLQEMGDVPRRKHTGRNYLDRDSGLGLSVNSTVLMEEDSVVTNPVEDREECNYPVQDTSGPNE